MLKFRRTGIQGMQPQTASTIIGNVVGRGCQIPDGSKPSPADLQPVRVRGKFERLLSQNVITTLVVSGMTNLQVQPFSASSGAPFEGRPHTGPQCTVTEVIS